MDVTDFTSSSSAISSFPTHPDVTPNTLVNTSPHLYPPDDSMRLANKQGHNNIASHYSEKQFKYQAIDLGNDPIDTDRDEVPCLGSVSVISDDDSSITVTPSVLPRHKSNLSHEYHPKQLHPVVIPKEINQIPCLHNKTELSTQKN